MMNKRNRKRIGIPRGMLRHLSLQIFKQRPMSGSEIVDQIEDYTDWRPSPGSIYPLLSGLQEENLIKPFDDSDPSLKRFELTEQGLKLVDEMLENDPRLKNRQLSLRKMYWKMHVGMSESLYSSFENLMSVIEDVCALVRNNPDASAKLGSALDTASSIIREVEA